MRSKLKSIFIALGISSLFFAISIFVFTIQQALLVGMIALMVVLWTNNGLAMAVVSLLPIIMFPAASILDTKTTAANYAHPIIFLFLGGFLLAIAVEKSGLHRWLAHQILSIFPDTPRGIIFSLTISSGLLSAVLSNTTSALLLMSIALFLSDDVKIKMRFALAVAYGASVGGILTPIGTPPNLILLGILDNKGIESFSFLGWVMMMLPLVVLMFFIVAWVLSLKLPKITIKHDLTTQTLTYNQKKVLFVFIGLIVILFINAPIKPYYNGLGLNESGILLTAGLILFAPPFKILKWGEDKAKIPFEIMFLFGAGFSIAAAFTQTELANLIASYLVLLTSLPSLLLLLIIASLVTFTTEITSNTALISMMLPVIYSVSIQAGLDTRLFMLTATICASYAFMLPIATPPNAIAMSSGAVRIKDMAKFGIVFNIVGILMIVLIASLYWKIVL